MTRPLVSLVIATYNRARLLREALESVAASTITPSSSVEVIVVDNNSTDGTAAAIGSVRRDGFPFQLSYIKETRQGTSYARNTGIAAARGRYVAFMDDDQRIDPDYLANVQAAFEETGAACVGGPVRYYNADDIPGWLAPILEHKGQLDCGDTVKTIQADSQKLGGGNMAFKQADLADIGEFDTRLGHHGENLGGSEDWEIQDRAIAHGKRVVYHPKLIQYHYLRPERYQKRYWRKLYFAYGRSLSIRADLCTANLFLGVPRYMWWLLVTRDIRTLLSGWLSFDRPHLFSRQLRVWLQLGRIYEARRIQRTLETRQIQPTKSR